MAMDAAGYAYAFVDSAIAFVDLANAFVDSANAFVSLAIAPGLRKVYLPEGACND
ncbi:MAG: hypothetical protein V7K89_33890 [Nostoc sp.]|uniref:hypothetical protein n=1 Tax=Nostoc sp. TaxID=1180 RepID=UPI002FF74D96